MLAAILQEAKSVVSQREFRRLVLLDLRGEDSDAAVGGERLRRGAPGSGAADQHSELAAGVALAVMLHRVGDVELAILLVLRMEGKADHAAFAAGFATGTMVGMSLDHAEYLETAIAQLDEQVDRLMETSTSEAGPRNST